MPDSVLGGVDLNQVFQAIGLNLPAQDTPAPDGPVSSPSQVPGVDTMDQTPVSPAPTPTSQSGSVGANTSVSTEQRGFSGAKADQIEARAKRPGGIYGRLYDIDQQANQKYADVQAAQDKSAAEQKQAIAQGTDVERAKIVKQGQQSHELADMNQKMAEEESRQSLISAQKVTQQASNYEAALRDFAAAGVNPGQLWHNMSGGDQVGMLATAFVHDFLGVRGIHTSAMDTFNRAVDQNIAAQVENIKKKGQVADGFRSLWQMATEQSKSEAEARLRVRGYMVESFKNQVAAELAGYDSQLAQAKGMAAIAAVDGEQAKLKGDLLKVWQENANADKSAAVSIYGHQLAASASLDAARISAGAHLASAQAEAQAKKQENAQKTAVRIPENTPGRAVFGPDGLPHQIPGTTPLAGFANTPEEAAKAQEHINNVYNLTSQANEYIKELNDIGSHYQGPLASKFQSVDAARVDVLRQKLAIDLDKAIGGAKAASQEKLIEKYDQFFRKADWTSVDSVKKAVASASTIIQEARQSAVTDVATLRRPMDQEEAAMAGVGVGNETNAIGPNASAPRTFAPAQATELNANAHNLGEDPASNTPAIQIGKDIQENNASAKGSHVEDPGSRDGQEVEQFLSQHQDLKSPEFGKVPNQGVVAVPNWASEMMKLQDLATPNAKSANPVFRNLPDQYSPDERSQARQILEEFASGGVKGQDGVAEIDSDKILFAQYLLSEITKSENDTQNAR